MIAVDTNLLVYAHRREMPQHAKALAAITILAEGSGEWALPWHAVHEFIAVVTNPKVFKPASSMTDAWKFLDNLIAASNLRLLSEIPGYYESLKKTANSAGVVGPEIYDARIAALCIQHGVTEFWTADSDFEKFPTLRIYSPLS